MTADLGLVDLACEYRAGVTSVPAGEQEVEVALRNRQTDLDQRRVVVRGDARSPAR